MIADTQRIRHDGKSGIHRSARWEEAAVDDVEIVDVMRLAIRVERRCCGVAAEPDGAVLVRDAGQRNALTNVEIAREESLVAVAPMKRAVVLLHHMLKMGFELVMRSKVVR